jgi:dipeptidyl aminopeptidase/acylaminoacyl peptidase
MTELRTAPYGSWPSPITSELIVSDTVGIGQIEVEGGDVWWAEARPAEQGRVVVVRRRADGGVADALGPGWNARTRVHEYGGSCFAVDGDTLYFANFADQRLYRSDAGGEPRALTPEGDLRYADLSLDRGRSRLLCVLEDHTRGGAEAVNCIAAVPLEGGTPEVLVEGSDFCAAPRVSPDGDRICWLTWNHPDLPWDGTELWVAELDAAGRPGEPVRVAGGPRESVVVPAWSPGGVLHLVSDRTGWWNLYRWRGGELEALAPAEMEFARPAWMLGWTTYAFLGEERIVCTATQRGEWRLYELHPETGLCEVRTPFTEISPWLRAHEGGAVFAGGSPTLAAALVHVDVESGATEVLRRSSSLEIDQGYLSQPEAVEFPTEGGRTAHALYYPPRNPEWRGPEDERPPLLVETHGGPTAAATTLLRLPIQYWTSRGIAVLDVNYGGSTGYGREYRERLYGSWGVVDVDDCANGALFLVERGDADPNRLMISGGSAGGYTTLCALTFRDTFSAGASHFGIGDLEVFVGDTHKFESRYLDRLIGPLPEAAALYRERSPINHTDRLSCPVILFQGLEDRIVPPNQAELMFEALRRKGIPCAYVPFAGEQHGFRIAANIRRSLDGELYFYSRVLGFPLAEALEPVEIENLPGEA